MTQRYDENLILGYLEGDLTPSQRAKFEAQLEADPPLRELVQAMVKDRTALRSLPVETSPAGMMQAVHERLERTMLLDNPAPEAALPIARHRTRMARVLVITAMAALLLFVAGLVLQVWIFTLGIDEPKPMHPMAMKPESPSKTMSLPPPEKLAMADPPAPGPKDAVKVVPSVENLAGSVWVDRRQDEVDTSGKQALEGEGSLVARDRADTDMPVTPTAPVAIASPAASPATSFLTEAPTTPTPREPAADSLALGEGHRRERRLASRTTTAGERLSERESLALNNPLARPRNLRVVTPDPQSAKADLEQWALANSVNINTPTSEEMARRALGQSLESGGQRFRQPQTPARDQLYRQYLSPTQAQDIHNPAQRPMPATEPMMVNMRLPVQQLPALLHQLHQARNGRSVQVLEDIDPWPPPMPDAGKQAAASTTQPGKDENESLDSVDVMVEFVETEPAETAKP